MSAQEYNLLKLLEIKPYTVKQLREQLPPHDQRTRLVQEASLCRSLRRLAERQLVRKENYTYLLATEKSAQR